MYLVFMSGSSPQVYGAGVAALYCPGESQSEAEGECESVEVTEEMWGAPVHWGGVSQDELVDAGVCVCDLCVHTLSGTRLCACANVKFLDWCGRMRLFINTRRVWQRYCQEGSGGGAEGECESVEVTHEMWEAPVHWGGVSPDELVDAGVCVYVIPSLSPWRLRTHFKSRHEPPSPRPCLMRI